MTPFLGTLRWTLTGPGAGGGNAAAAIGRDRAGQGAHDTRSRLHELGVRGVRKIPQLHPSHVICKPHDFDLAVLDPQGGRTVAGVIEQLAGQKAAKLARADADERHLFIWIDFFQKTTLADLGHTDLPKADHVLPAPSTPPRSPKRSAPAAYSSTAAATAGPTMAHGRPRCRDTTWHPPAAGDRPVQHARRFQRLVTSSPAVLRAETLSCRDGWDPTLIRQLTTTLMMRRANQTCLASLSAAFRSSQARDTAHCAIHPRENQLVGRQ